MMRKEGILVPTFINELDQDVLEWWRGQFQVEVLFASRDAPNIYSWVGKECSIQMLLEYSVDTYHPILLAQRYADYCLLWLIYIYIFINLYIYIYSAR